MSDSESDSQHSEHEYESGEEEEIEFEFTCDNCNEGIYSSEPRFHCDICEDFDLCESCFFDEESEVTHEHKLREVREGRVLFAHEDKRTGHLLYLGDFRAALSSSSAIKNHNVKAVLSAVDFNPKGNFNKELDQLQEIYGLKKEIPTSTTVKKDNVVYHHINMPDLQKPSLLHDYNLPHVLEEATSFLDVSMTRGNVLIHCERGQFRSPTLLVAWLVTRGMTVDDAMKHIDEGYLIEGKKDGWGKKYSDSRPEWVSRLKMWENNHKQDKQDWLQKNHLKVQKWKDLWGGATSGVLRDNEGAPTTATTEPDKKKRRSTESGGDDIAVKEAKKLRKVIDD